MINRLKKCNKIRAFTLVELIIALSIMGTAMGIGTVSYVSFNEKKIIEETAKNLRSDLLQAQKRALSNEKDNEVCKESGETLDLNGWCFSPNQDAGTGEIESYQFYGSCGPKEGVKTFPTQNQWVSKQLPSGVTMQSWVTINGTQYNNRGGKLLFRAGTNGVQILASNPSPPPSYIDLESITYCLSSSFPSLIGGDNYYKITVTANGEIQDSGFVTNCP